MAVSPIPNTTPGDRRLGQVFTPRPVADWMAHWVCTDSPKRILDPCVGHGVFIDAIESVWHAKRTKATRRKPQLDTCEIDAAMLDRFTAAPRKLAASCRHEDFITASFPHRYDAIIANPPYVRHHDMTYGEDVLRSVDALCGRRLSRMTNLYGLFLLKIHSLLADGGRAAVITPAEWLNADFGRPLKTCLLEQNAIDAIVQFDHAASVFDGALTTAAVTLLRRGRSDTDPIRLCPVSSIDELAALDVNNAPGRSHAALNPNAKWTPLFAPHASNHAASRTLADIARCTRGIATGANNYFTLRESDRKKWGIDRKDLSLCVTKSQFIPGDRLTQADVDRLIESDQRVYLLSPRERLSTPVKAYLAEGERLGIPNRYLPSHRPIWFRPENRPPAPILASVFARGAFRFVLNEAGVQNLTTFHGVYPNTPTPARVRALWKYLTSEAAHKALIAHRRIYADGLNKLEPRDVESIPIPDSLK